MSVCFWDGIIAPFIIYMLVYKLIMDTINLTNKIYTGLHKFGYTYVLSAKFRNILQQFNVLFFSVQMLLKYIKTHYANNIFNENQKRCP